MVPKQLRTFFLLLALFGVGCASVRKGVIQGTDHGASSSSIVPGAGEVQVELHTADGTAMAALFGVATDREGRPLADAAHRTTVLYFYPGGYTVQRSRAVFDGFRRLGCNVLVPEYPGFGASTGEATERGCYEAADAAWAWLQGRDDVDPLQIVVAGWSVGGGVAVDLAAREPAAGLIVIGTSTRIQDVARNLANSRWTTAWIPSWFLRTVTTQCRLDSLAKMPRVRMPVLVVYGERDKLATKAMAKRLVAAAPSGAKLTEMAGVGHTDFFRVNSEALWHELGVWLNALPRGHSHLNGG